MNYADIRERVLTALASLKSNNLVNLTQGNVSEYDREKRIIAIKPSGVKYEMIKKEDIVIVDLFGNRIDGTLNPSVDLKTHIVLYNQFPEINSIVHTHSHWATIFAQCGLSIPVVGTTHADDFGGIIKCTDYIEPIEDDYEEYVGEKICEQFSGKEYLKTPAILVKGHGPFCWGQSSVQAVEKAIVLEYIASLTWHTMVLCPTIPQMPDSITEKHFLRKNGKESYYGQKGDKHDYNGN